MKSNLTDIVNRCQKYFLLALLLLRPELTISGEDPGFFIQVLHLTGEVHEVFVKDINVDGKPDLIISHNTTHFPDSRLTRSISIFQQKNGHFPQQPTQTLLMEKGEILFDFENIDKDPFPELIFLTKDGVYIRKYVNSSYSETYSRIVESHSLFLVHDPSKLRRWPFVQDLDGDRIPEIIIPQPDRFNIYSQNSDGEYTFYRGLWTTTEYTLSDENTLCFTHQLPDLHVRHFNNDSIPDILLICGDRLDVYLQKKNRFHIHPSAILPNFRYKMAARSVNTSELEALAPPSIALEAEDLNGDGCVDILLTKAPRASFTTSINQIQIYLNKNGRLEMLPDQILTAENFGGEHHIKDFNHDGLLDLSILTFKIGFTQAAKFLITKKAGNSYDFYPMSPDNTYPLKPVEKLSFSRNINIGTLIGPGLCQNFDGDFNGDGISDMVLGTGNNELSIFTGVADGFFHKKVFHKIRVRTSTHIHVQDLNQDSISDILLWYHETEQLSHDLILVLSKQ